jgi:hypothetical protein
MAQPGAFSGAGGDPRLHHAADRPDTYISPQQRLLHDPEVTFEEYHYYALKTRAEEDASAANDTRKTGILQVSAEETKDQFVWYLPVL